MKFPHVDGASDAATWVAELGSRHSPLPGRGRLIAEGPEDRCETKHIPQHLVLIGERDTSPVLEATRRIGRFVQLVEFAAAAVEFDRRAQQAANEIAQVGKLTVQEGNPGDDAVNDWIATMLGIYRAITGKEPATSVGAPERSNEGIAAGPLIYG
jgi:hypothetical protein